MNRISIVLAAVVAFSFVFTGFFSRGLRSPLLSAIWKIQHRHMEKEHKNSLEQDLKDIFDIFPWDDIRFIVGKYIKFDKQIDNTITFFKDHRKFIWNALKKIPHFQLFIFILNELELKVDHLVEKFEQFASSLPECNNTEEKIKSGGLSEMIHQILIIIPREKLHILLCEKVKNSYNFRTLLLLLNSQQFLQLCKSIKMNAELQRHFYWANENGIEIIFASELLIRLYIYLIQNIYIDNYVNGN
ncbi:PREDICTED: uncharacterized protein LOC105363637 [Ceratosolen solmsi marchali]|uniref:Uncharacterized protein LOC105363637 n=1 Tax=Ceratosolen solmsi marchali TaxID=326594 RepID=A0AAJ6YKD8_9HYME|nr:PREDICTED: uncharacterized protein LOC105363637 [Ceratosolen solmsi marchali]